MAKTSGQQDQDRKFHLIPYEIVEAVKEITEIPEGVRLIEAPEIWNDSEKGNDVVVAILDTGCQIDHPDLRDRIIGGRNFILDEGGPDDFYDREGHGTHVAGTIGATENNSGVVGVAPQVRLLILKVLGRDGGPFQAIIDAINYAVDWRGPNNERVRVINMSLGGSFDDPELHQAVKRAVDNDILVVCAAGNEGDFDECTIERSYPGAYPESVCVGAVDLNKQFTKFTNTNESVDLVAPGANILSTWSDGTYMRLNGTSMAAPHVSGAAALIIKQCERDFGRTLTESEIYAQLIKRTTPLGFTKKAEGNGFLTLSKNYGNPPAITCPTGVEKVTTASV